MQTQLFFAAWSRQQSIRVKIITGSLALLMRIYFPKDYLVATHHALDSIYSDRNTKHWLQTLGTIGLQICVSAGALDNFWTSSRHFIDILSRFWIFFLGFQVKLLVPLHAVAHYRLENRMNLFTGYHYRYRLGVRSHPCISIVVPNYHLGSHLNYFSLYYRYRYRLEMFWN